MIRDPPQHWQATGIRQHPWDWLVEVKVVWSRFSWRAPHCGVLQLAQLHIIVAARDWDIGPGVWRLFFGNLAISASVASIVCLVTKVIKRFNRAALRAYKSAECGVRVHLQSDR